MGWIIYVCIFLVAFFLGTTYGMRVERAIIADLYHVGGTLSEFGNEVYNRVHRLL